MRTPLVGRAEEIASFRAALSDPYTTAQVLTGAAGVGKTRLAEECVRVAASRGHPSAWVAATDAAATIPLGAFAHLLPTPRADADRFELLHTALNHLMGQAREHGQQGRLVLAVDDAHLLDQGSEALLSQLTGPGKVFVLATVRTGEEWPEALVSLWTAGRADRLQLAPLSAPGTEELASGILGGPVGRTTLRELWRLSEGLPLMAREVLLAARDSGVLRAEEGVWRHRGQLAVTDRFTTLVDARLGRLDDVERGVLEHLVVGEPLGLALLAELTDIAAVGRLERRGLVVTRREGARVQAEIVHPLHREILADGLPVAQRAAISRRLADAVDRRGARRRDDVPRLAAWRLDGGGAADSSLFLEAAQQAAAAFDYAFTERLARAALAAGGGAAAQLALGRALAGQGRIAEADEVLAAAATGAPDDKALSRGVRARADLLARTTGDYAGAVETLRHARRQVTDPAAADGLVAAEVAVHALAGDAWRCLSLADELLARPDLTDRVRLSTLAASVGIRAMAGDVGRALSDAEQARTVLGRVDEPAAMARVLVGTGRGLALLGLGRLREAERECRGGYDRAVDEDVPEVAGSWAVVLGAVLLERGRPVQARVVLADAASSLTENDPLDLRAAALALVATAAAMLGDAGAARRWLAELDGRHAAGSARFAGWVARARAWTAAAEGQLTEACAHLSQGAPRQSEGGAARPSEGGAARRTGLPLVDLAGLVDLVRFGQPDIAVPALADVAGRVDSAYVATLAAYAREMASGDAAGLEYLSGQLAGYDADLVAAEAATRAADLFARHGRHRRAEQLSAVARQHAAECEGVRSPALTTPPAQLTARETEIARLAAQQTTSDEIARRLGVSRRTVDNHLAAVYTKLGINRRTELSRVLGLAGE